MRSQAKHKGTNDVKGFVWKVFWDSFGFYVMNDKKTLRQTVEVLNKRHVANAA